MPSIEGGHHGHSLLSGDIIVSSSTTSSGTESPKKPSELHARPYSMPPGGLETPPQSKPPLPPKPARLYRKLPDIKAEDRSLDEDESDDDDEDDDLEGMQSLIRSNSSSSGQQRDLVIQHRQTLRLWDSGSTECLTLSAITSN